MTAAIPLALFAAGVGIQGIATAGAAEAQRRGGEIQIQQLRNQQLQQQIALADRSKQRTRASIEATASTVASAAARGVSSASTTLSAINERNFGRFKEDERADKLNERFQESKIQTQIGATRAREQSAIFGAWSQFGTSLLKEVPFSSFLNFYGQSRSGLGPGGQPGGTFFPGGFGGRL